MEKVYLGKVINVRGLKGEMKIDSSTHFSSLRYKKGSKIILEKDGDSRIFTVLSFSKVGLFDYVKFIEVDNCDEANKYRGYELFVNIDSLHTLESNSYYFYELNGCQVYDENNDYLGIVNEVIENPGNYLIRIIHNDSNILIPLVKKFIIKVDIKTKTIIINKMEGLV